MSQHQYTIEDLENLAAQIKDLRTEVEEKGKIKAEAQARLDDKEAQAIGVLKELNKKSYQGAAGTITRVEAYRINLPDTPEAKEAFRKFLEERGEFDQYYTFNSNKINSFYMNEWETAKASDDPMDALNFGIPGIQEPKMRETISFRKGK